MISRNPQLAVDKVAEAQAIRDRNLGRTAFSTTQLRAADAALEDICSRPESEAFMVHPVQIHEYIRRAVVFTWGWYSGRIMHGTPDKPPLRAQVAKVVIFREAFMRHANGQTPWEILATVCELESLRGYAEAGCIHPDLSDVHFFLHSSLSARLLKPEQYASIERDKWATILYPMYEAEIMAALAGFVAAAFGVEYGRWRNRRRRSVDADDEATLRKRVKSLETELSETRSVVRYLLLEMEIRRYMLLERITDRLGRIQKNDLKRLYLDEYLPTVEAIRASRGIDVPTGLETAVETVDAYTDAIAPHFCEAVTADGTRCRRPAPGRARFCWQHARQGETTPNKGMERDS